MSWPEKLQPRRVYKSDSIWYLSTESPWTRTSDLRGSSDAQLQAIRSGFPFFAIIGLPLVDGIRAGLECVLSARVCCSVVTYHPSAGPRQLTIIVGAVGHSAEEVAALRSDASVSLEVVFDRTKFGHN